MNMLGRIKIGTTLSPIAREGVIRTGHGIVLDCIPLPDYMLARKSMYNYDCLYVVLTDFGNTFKMSLPEMIEAYEFGDVDDVKERSLKIIENHKSVLESLL